MIQKIAILGSTGSIGKCLLKIINKDKKNFKISLLTAKKNYQTILKQALYFNVKNIIITDQKYFELAKKENKNKKINIYNNFKTLDKILNKRIDYTMSSIIGIEGLKPTINIIKHTKRIAIANKESIVCGWSLINKELIKNNTKFIPVDSEHFSIWFALKNEDILNVEKIYITASGGPFLNTSLKKLEKVKLSQALKHPNWKMGKKISIDSATMMNKVFEVIEAKNIFNIPYNKISILTHPNSYIHAIIKYKNGIIKTILHDTTMEIPIHNSLYDNQDVVFKSQDINLKILNNPKFNKIDLKKFPLINILKKLPKKNSLFETILVTANDKFVKYYLDGKIEFKDLQKNITKLINIKQFKKYKRIKAKTVENILDLNEYVRLKINI